ncbi:MAG TPA: DEAD/DEAH box helicase [Gemmatimonadaceae bacterium]
MIRNVLEPYLPDHQSFIGAEPSSGRVIVIAPTRAACETIELAVQLHIETFLEIKYGARVRELARSGQGFGIVAGTGTGKTLAIRPIAEEILRTKTLKVGVVNREREATPETPTWNVIVVTTGIARRWFEEGDILAADTIIVDEIHQTSAELELCLALGKRVGCRFVWLSATVNPAFYAKYLNSGNVLEVFDFDPQKAARVKIIHKKPSQFLDESFLRQLVKERRGVALFVPTRRGVEEAAGHVRRMAPRVNTAFYHGGEPIRILRPFLEGGEQKPYFLAMTAAGQSALNVRGLDTVIIDDTKFFNVIDRGRNVLTQEHLGANEILQMAGRVHGRVEGGRVFILSDRDIQFEHLEPTEPEFQLAGDSERVAITCAALGVRADELDLPVPLDRVAYRNALALLESRGIVDKGRLTRYGRAVEAMPVARAWAELLVNGDDALVPNLSVMASIESLHRMTREERDLNGLIVPGSDNLTAYNLYAEAYQCAGTMGSVYGLPRHVFDEEKIGRWAERRGALVKSIEDAALGMASIYRAVGLQLPERMENAGEATLRAFQQLLAQYMPFTLVIDETTASGDEARVSKTSVCGSWGPITGELRYFADKFGKPRASIEGSQIPYDMLRQFATVTEGELIYNAESKRSPLVLRRRVEYHGFELEREIDAIEEFPPALADKARHVLAEALARGEARHPGVRANLDAVESVRETYRRSGGKTARLSLGELTALYEAQLADVNSMGDFRHARVHVDPDAFVVPEERARYAALPSTTRLRDRDVEIHYDVEETPEGNVGVARLRLPEKVARSLTESELPTLDRPLRFIVTRGVRGAARAKTLEELQDELDRPFTDKEIADMERAHDEHRRDRQERKRHDRQHRDRQSGGRKRRNTERRVDASPSEEPGLKDERQARDERLDGRRQRDEPNGKRFRPPGPRGRGGRRRRRD